MTPEPMENVMSLTATTFPNQRETRSSTIGASGALTAAAGVAAVAGVVPLTSVIS